MLNFVQCTGCDLTWSSNLLIYFFWGGRPFNFPIVKQLRMQRHKGLASVGRSGKLNSFVQINLIYNKRLKND